MATDLSQTAPPRGPRAALALETAGSLVALVAIGGLFVNWLGAHLTFFGDPVVVDPEAVRSYWLLVCALAAGVLASFVGAGWRKARAAYLWHACVAIVGLAAAVIFAVTTAGPAGEDPEPSSPSPTGPHCHSGGDSHECPGG